MRRYAQADLPYIHITNTGRNSQAVPERREADILSHPNVIPDSQESSETGLVVTSHGINFNVDCAHAESAEKEEGSELDQPLVPPPSVTCGLIVPRVPDCRSPIPGDCRSPHNLESHTPGRR
jgi:hypothetical protein